MDSSPFSTLSSKQSRQTIRHSASYELYSIGFSHRSDFPNRLAVGSFIDQAKNFIKILNLDSKTGQLEEVAELNHQYLATKLKWLPSSDTSKADLLITSGHQLSIWDINQGKKAKLIRSLVMKPDEGSTAPPPLTSFDWNRENLNIVVTSSIDTTCVVWDIEKAKPIKSILAHDREVFDITFCPDHNLFATVSADGSSRIFDFRNPKTSDVLMENQGPLAKIAWNFQNKNQVALVSLEGNQITIVDHRKGRDSTAILTHNKDPISCVEWSPEMPNYLCSGSQDKELRIWDVPTYEEILSTPAASFKAEAEIFNLSWNSVDTNWIAFCSQNRVELLKVC